MLAQKSMGSLLGTLAYEFPSSTLFILGHFRKVVRGASACGIPFAKQMYNYQIAIFENGNVTQAGALRTALDGRLSDLGVDSAAVKYFDEETVASRDPRAAFVAVYFAGIGSHKLVWAGARQVAFCGVPEQANVTLPLKAALPVSIRLNVVRKRAFVKFSLYFYSSSFNEIDCQVCLDHKLFIFCELSRQEQRRGLDRTRRSLSSPDGTF